MEYPDDELDDKKKMVNIYMHGTTFPKLYIFWKAQTENNSFRLLSFRKLFEQGKFMRVFRFDIKLQG